MTAGVKDGMLMVQDVRTISSVEEIMKTSGFRCMIVEKDEDIKAKELHMSISGVESGRGGGK